MVAAAAAFKGGLALGFSNLNFQRKRGVECLHTDALLGETGFQMISPVYNNMKGEGLEPNGFTYNMLLKALCKNRKMDSACKLLEEMSNKGCPPDAVSYTTIVSSVCKLGQVEKAKELANGFNPVVPAYNALINDFCK
nr:pentatricopeptide repeat-containing protein At3g48810-like [Arachis hypogaea]